MSEWIKCSDKLPEISGRYLVFQIKEEHSHNCAAFNYPYPCCKSNIAYFREFNPGDWNWASNVNNPCEPTHWMTLPEPPEE